MKTKLSILFSLMIFVIAQVYSQTLGDVLLLGQYDDDSLPTASGVQYSDVWGYANDSGEFAVVGNAEFILFFDVTDPTDITEIFSFDAGDPEIWRDFKTYDGFVYAVCDGCSEGLHIFSTDGATVTHEMTTTQFFSRAHNIYIDEANAKLYAVGVPGSTDMIVLDISTPDDPALIENINFGDSGSGFYVHDVFVKDNIAYCSHGWDGYYVWDLNDPANPIELGSTSTGNYNHSSWTNGDDTYAYFAEEVPTGVPMAVVDLENLGSSTDDIEVIHTFQDGIESSGQPTPHNPFVVGDLLVISYYEDGIKIYDLADDPEIPVLVGQFDTYAENNGLGYNGYNGNWGTYPFLPSGNILATDIDHGLHVLQYLPSGTANCVDVDFNDGENGFGIWNDGGADAALTNNANFANSGTFSFQIKDNTSTSVITSNILDLADAIDIELDFNYITNGFNNSNEDFFLEISTNGGVSFTEVEEWNLGDEFENDIREFETITIPGPFTFNTVLRFRCDASGNNDRVFIDDILIKSCTLGVGTCDDGIQNGDEIGIDCGGSNCNPCTGCDTVDFNDGENGFLNWIDGGADAALTRNPDVANSGTFSFLIKDNTNTSNITSTVYDLNVYNSIDFTFNYITTGFNNPNQDFWLQVSTDGGATFTTIEEWNYTDEFLNGVREFETVSYPGPMSSNMVFRFICDATGNNDKVYIDDILIESCFDGSGGPIQSPIPHPDETAIDTRQLSSKSEINIHPNPISGSDILKIEFPNEVKSFVIRDLNGQMVFRQEKLNTDIPYAFDTNTLESGTYIIVGQTNNGLLSKIFVVID